MPDIQLISSPNSTVSDDIGSRTGAESVDTQVVSVGATERLASSVGGTESVGDGPNPRRSVTNDLAGNVAPAVATIGIAIALWAAVTMASGPASVTRPFNPLDAFRALARLVGDGSIWLDVRVSLIRLGTGLAIATALGITVGCATGSIRLVERATTPLFQFVRMISPVAWTPVAIVILGVGSAPAIALIALTAVWPLILGTAAGVRGIPHGWIELARSLGATRTETFRTITVPAIRLPVLTALRVSLGVAWIVLVPVEMLGSSEGLGYSIMNAKDALAYDELMATIIIVGVLGFLLDSGLRLVVDRAGRRRAIPL